jgi:hypothetical protein
MSSQTTLMLARATAAPDRERARLVAIATAIAAALILAGLRISRLSGGLGGGPGDALNAPGEPLARLTNENGLRPGLVAAIALLTVPVLALGVQALRAGSVARDRRMAALRLAGATPRQARGVAATEAGAAALLGGLAAGPAYLALWLILGVLPPAGTALLPTPNALDLPAWLGVVVLVTLGGAVAGAAVERRALTEPLGVHRQMRSDPPGLVNLAAAVVGLALLLAGTLGAVKTVPAFTGALLFAMAAGPRVVILSGRWLSERDGPEALLAGFRLLADPRTFGRAAGVLVVCGIALGIDASLTGAFIVNGTNTDTAFYFGGFALAGLGILIASGVALATLVVGAAEGLLDARRAVASLAAFGVDERTLRRVLAVQLQAVAAPAVALGVCTSGVAIGVTSNGLLLAVTLPLMLLSAGLAGLLAAVGAAGAARLLRSRLRAAADPGNLRLA